MCRYYKIYSFNIRKNKNILPITINYLVIEVVDNWLNVYYTMIIIAGYTAYAL